MAIGDQVHWAGTGSSSTDLRPSSGVEIIVKECTTGYRSQSGYNNFHHAYHRSSSAYYGAATINGSPISWNQSMASTYGASDKNPNMASSPINNTYYIYMTTGGAGAAYKVAGYITKD